MGSPGTKQRTLADFCCSGDQPTKFTVSLSLLMLPIGGGFVNHVAPCPPMAGGQNWVSGCHSHTTNQERNTEYSLKSP